MWRFQRGWWECHRASHNVKQHWTVKYDGFILGDTRPPNQSRSSSRWQDVSCWTHKQQQTHHLPAGGNKVTSASDRNVNHQVFQKCKTLHHSLFCNSVRVDLPFKPRPKVCSCRVVSRGSAVPFENYNGCAGYLNTMAAAPVLFCFSSTPAEVSQTLLEWWIETWELRTVCDVHHLLCALVN